MTGSRKQIRVLGIGLGLTTNVDSTAQASAAGEDSPAVMLGDDTLHHWLADKVPVLKAYCGQGRLSAHDECTTSSVPAECSGSAAGPVGELDFAPRR